MNRGCGLLLHISSLPSPGCIGDFGESAYRFADFCVAAGQSCWQILPLNPTDGGSWHSPYLSCGTFAGNPFFIALQSLVDEGLLKASEVADYVQSTAAGVDHAAAESMKMPLLHKAYDRARRRGWHKKAIEKFCHDQASWLEDYALFCVLKSTHNQRQWSEWPERVRNRDAATLQKLANKNKDALRRIQFMQYLFSTQWTALKSYCNRRGLALIGDVPIYVAYDSCDVWAHPEIFKLDKNHTPYVVSGVPPDYFSAGGQLWNTPVYSWDTLRQNGYAWWIRRLEAQLRRCDLVRIDHFRGLVQFWEVPAGESTAINGAWQSVPVYDFFDTLIQSFPDLKNRIIAEDLGVITDDVRAVKAHYQFPGMTILQFAFSDDNPQHPYLPENFERNCLAYTGTHDNNTMRGWLEVDANAGEKHRFFKFIGGETNPEAAVWLAIQRLMESRADRVILPVQDILTLGDDARMNKPAVPQSNWRWRLAEGQLTAALAARLKEIAASTGRIPQPSRP
jgi:4-alpha-glucanotransferase